MKNSVPIELVSIIPLTICYSTDIEGEIETIDIQDIQLFSIFFPPENFIVKELSTLLVYFKVLRIQSLFKRISDLLSLN